MIQVETNSIKRVKDLYPNAKMYIDKVWSDDHGWVPIDEAFVSIDKPKIRSFKYLLNKFKKYGFNKVNLKITKERSKPINSDFSINELVGV